MADKTSIEWTRGPDGSPGATWNPITGCTLVSEGCRHCYAAQLAATRLKNHWSRAGLARLNAAGEAKFTGEVRFNEQWLDQPLRWTRPRRIFVCAHGDLFHEDVPDEWIDAVFAVMALARRHTCQILTKRPERAAAYLKTEPDMLRDRWYRAVRAGQWCVSVAEAYAAIHPHASDEIRALHHREAPVWPLPNVWLGTSVEDQATADARIPHLLAAPAAVRFLSAEPLLGPVDLTEIAVPRPDLQASVILDVLRGWGGPINRLDWVIVGGESGKHARPMHPDWVRALRDQCQAAGVAFFFKQWGEWAPSSPEEARGNPRYGMKGLKGYPHVARREELTPEAGAAFVEHKGKKAAGRVLDGRTWDETPGAEG